MVLCMNGSCHTNGYIMLQAKGFRQWQEKSEQLGMVRRAMAPLGGVYLHVCTHTYIHTYINAYVHAHIHASKYAYIHACIHTYANSYVHAPMRSAPMRSVNYMYTHVYTRACIDKYMNIYPYIHTYV